MHYFLWLNRNANCNTLHCGCKLSYCIIFFKCNAKDTNAFNSGSGGLVEWSRSDVDSGSRLKSEKLWEATILLEILAEH